GARALEAEARDLAVDAVDETPGPVKEAGKRELSGGGRGRGDEAEGEGGERHLVGRDAGVDEDARQAPRERAKEVVGEPSVEVDALSQRGVELALGGGEVFLGLDRRHEAGADDGEGGDDLDAGGRRADRDVDEDRRGPFVERAQRRGATG